MSTLRSPLADYVATRELHETRANHLAIVEADIAAFWADPRPSPAAVSTPEEIARVRRLTRLMAERGAVVVVEQQAYDALVTAIERLVASLPAGEPHDSAGRLLDAWPAERASLEAMDAGASTIDTAHRAMIAAVRGLLDPLAEQRSPFTA
jgi:hypothetical protein